jgi:hypothetical protein
LFCAEIVVAGNGPKKPQRLQEREEWSALADDFRIFLGADRFEVAVSALS